MGRLPVGSRSALWGQARYGIWTDRFRERLMGGVRWMVCGVGRGSAGVEGGGLEREGARAISLRRVRSGRRRRVTLVPFGDMPVVLRLRDCRCEVKAHSPLNAIVGPVPAAGKPTPRTPPSQSRRTGTSTATGLATPVARTPASIADIAAIAGVSPKAPATPAPPTPPTPPAQPRRRREGPAASSRGPSASHLQSIPLSFPPTPARRPFSES